MSAATAIAHANIALVKYWGKRDATLNLPAAGSLSLTLDALTTTTTVEFGDAQADELSIDGKPASESAVARFSAWLDLVRTRAGIDARARVASTNNFPTASGLASSASAYAAAAVAASRAAGLSLQPFELSVLARRGSGSAARSIFGGFAMMNVGTRPDGSDAYAEPVPFADDWPVRMVIAVVGGGVKKDVSSRDAMDHCAKTSVLYDGWLRSVPGDLAAARVAIGRRDLVALGEVTAHSALTMHASAFAARPAVIFFRPATLECLLRVQALAKQEQVPAYCTMDAGPHVKVLTLADHVPRVSECLAGVQGVTRVIETGPGQGAQLIGTP